MAKSSKSKYRGSFGLRKNFRGKRVAPNGMPRASNAVARIPGKTVKGRRGLCKPTGSLSGVKFEVDGGGYETRTEVGKGIGKGRWVTMPKNCTRFVEPRSFA